MTQTKRTASDPEWVLMYKRGIPTAKIAAVAGVAETTVRYHLAIAAKRIPASGLSIRRRFPPHSRV